MSLLSSILLFSVFPQPPQAVPCRRTSGVLPACGQEVLLPTKTELQRRRCLEEVRCQLSLLPISAYDVIWYKLGVALSLISCEAEL